MTVLLLALPKASVTVIIFAIGLEKTARDALRLLPQPGEWPSYDFASEEYSYAFP